ncbi:MAG: acyltransferase [Pseudomonadota bacterium]
MTGKIQNIQALRGVAALLVFVAHIKGAEGDYGAGGDILPHVLFMGVTGVDLFFLISGYVMVHVTDHLPRNGAQSARFLLNRAGRIYPLYWAVTIALILLYAGKKFLFGEDTPIPNYLSSFLLAPNDHYPILPVGWTLVHEIYFYLAFALFLLFHRRLLPLFLVSWAGFVIAAQAADFGTLGAGPKVWLNALTLEFIVGCFIALAAKRGIVAFGAQALILGAAWLTVLFVLGANELYPTVMGKFMERMLIFTPPYALLLYGAVAIERSRSAVAPNYLIAAGDISYALYLVHVPVFLIVGKLLSYFAGPGSVDNVILVVAYGGFGITAAVAAHYWVEMPLLARTKKAADRLFKARATPTIRPDRAW